MFKTTPAAFILKIPPWPEFCAGNYRYFEHNEKHVTRVCKEFVLIFMFERTLYFTEDEHDITLGPGEWYIQVPGLKQEGKTGSPAPIYYYIHFNATGYPCNKNEETSFLSQHISDTSNSNKQIYFPINGRFEQQHFKSHLDQLDYLVKRKPLNILKTQAVFLNILDKLSSIDTSSASETHELAFQIMNYIAENFNKPLTLNQLSKEFNYSSDYLVRIVKKYYGITPVRYIQQLRIDKAKDLLANTDYTLSAISREIGYSDVSLLYKAFRNQEGVAPGTWRLNCRGF